jgi:hypothetical protein
MQRSDEREVVSPWVWWATFATKRTEGDGVLSAWIQADVARKVARGDKGERVTAEARS